MISRLIEGQLRFWLQKPHRKPLILRGARQVGKSTLVKKFAQESGLDLLDVNCELYTSSLAKIFESMDVHKIIREIEILLEKKIQKNSCLFLDEIQAIPHAIASLRYFFEKLPNLPVIASGSLLEFVLGEHSFSMPVGRTEYLFLGPVTFSEYLGSLGEKMLFDFFCSYRVGEDFPLSAHQKLLDHYLDFLLVGGMPEATFNFIKNKDLQIVREIHKSIVLNYKNDFAKYAKRIPLARLERIFDFVPSHVGQKIKYSNISENEQSVQIKSAIELLEKASVIHRVFHSHCSGLPLRMGKNEKIYKTLFLDVGLLNFKMGLHYKYIKDLFLNPSSEAQLLHRGILAEQFVGQHLLFLDPADPPEIFYWLRDGKSQGAEVDFILQMKTSLIPIEVKGGKTGAIRSLIQYSTEKKPPFSVKFSQGLPVFKIKKYETQKLNLLELPLYFCERLPNLCEPFL